MSAFVRRADREERARWVLVQPEGEEGWNPFASNAASDVRRRTIEGAPNHIVSHPAKLVQCFGATAVAGINARALSRRARRKTHKTRRVVGFCLH